MESINNEFSKEATGPSNETITFPWRARWVEISNDSTTVNLSYKFRSSADYKTLLPEEAVVPPITPRQVILNGSGAYRVSAYG